MRGILDFICSITLHLLPWVQQLSARAFKFHDTGRHYFAIKILNWIYFEHSQFCSRKKMLNQYWVKWFCLKYDMTKNCVDLQFCSWKRKHKFLTGPLDDTEAESLSQSPSKASFIFSQYLRSSPLGIRIFFASWMVVSDLLRPRFDLRNPHHRID